MIVAYGYGTYAAHAAIWSVVWHLTKYLLPVLLFGGWWGWRVRGVGRRSGWRSRWR